MAEQLQQAGGLKGWIQSLFRRPPKPPRPPKPDHFYRVYWDQK
jgi:hypothetical protein